MDYKKYVLSPLLFIPLVFYGYGVAFTLFMDRLYKSTKRGDSASYVDFPVDYFKTINTCNEDTQILYYGKKNACEEVLYFPWASEPLQPENNDHYQRRVTYTSPIIERSWTFWISEESKVVYKTSKPQRISDWK